MVWCNLPALYDIIVHNGLSRLLNAMQWKPVQQRLHPHLGPVSFCAGPFTALPVFVIPQACAPWNGWACPPALADVCVTPVKLRDTLAKRHLAWKSRAECPFRLTTGQLHIHSWTSFPRSLKEGSGVHMVNSAKTSHIRRALHQQGLLEGCNPSYRQTPWLFFICAVSLNKLPLCLPQQTAVICCCIRCLRNVPLVDPTWPSPRGSPFHHLWARRRSVWSGHWTNDHIIKRGTRGGEVKPIWTRVIQSQPTPLHSERYPQGRSPSVWLSTRSGLPQQVTAIVKTKANGGTFNCHHSSRNLCVILQRPQTTACLVTFRGKGPTVVIFMETPGISWQQKSEILI